MRDRFPSLLGTTDNSQTLAIAVWNDFFLLARCIRSLMFGIYAIEVIETILLCFGEPFIQHGVILYSSPHEQLHHVVEIDVMNSDKTVEIQKGQTTSEQESRQQENILKQIQELRTHPSQHYSPPYLSSITPKVSVITQSGICPFLPLRWLPLNLIILTSMEHHFVRMTRCHTRMTFRPVVRDSISKNRAISVETSCRDWA